MKTMKFASVLLLTPLLAACAAQQPKQVQNSLKPDLVDQYIYAVEQASQNRATTIYWVNPPTKEMVKTYLDKNSSGSSG